MILKIRYLKGFVILWGSLNSLYSVEVTKGGLIPSYVPYELYAPMMFLPYDSKTLIVGDQIAQTALAIIGDREQSNRRSTVFCISSDKEDFKRLSEYEINVFGLRPYFGLFHVRSEGLYPYYSSLPHVKPYEDFNRFAGSLLKPIDPSRQFLYGETYFLPTFNLHKFCERENLSKVHFIYLDCGGNELQILESDSELVKNAIVVFVKTYHQRIREGIDMFDALHSFMIKCGFELFSHYIYDSVIGDALYVKSKYVSAVFRSKEL